MSEDQNSLTAQKWVRIMCDYAADGVWDRGGCACTADDLPVSADIVTIIRGWQAWYEHNGTPWFDKGAHNALGLFIARTVKHHLPDWTVVFFDEGRISKEWRAGQPRGSFEYEIVLNEDGTFSP